MWAPVGLSGLPRVSSSPQLFSPCYSRVGSSVKMHILNMWVCSSHHPIRVCMKLHAASLEYPNLSVSTVSLLQEHMHWADTVSTPRLSATWGLWGPAGLRTTALSLSSITSFLSSFSGRHFLNPCDCSNVDAGQSLKSLLCLFPSLSNTTSSVITASSFLLSENMPGVERRKPSAGHTQPSMG